MPEQLIVSLSSTLDDLLEDRDIAVKAISAVAVVKTSYEADVRRTTPSCLDDVRNRRPQGKLARGRSLSSLFRCGHREERRNDLCSGD